MIDISTFRKVDGLLDGSRWLLVVKSQDQIRRRQRMIRSRQGKQFGRLEARPTAIGLLVGGALRSGAFCIDWIKEFREPRHIFPLTSGEYLLTTMNCLLKLDSQFNCIDHFTHPYFAFLHTVDVRSDEKKVLIVSSGYDSIFELDLQSGEETFRWFAWDHGFNPDEDGYWLTADRTVYDLFRQQRKKTLLIDPAEYGDQGLVTARRSAHPNAARYNVFDSESSMIVSIGHTGNLYQVNLNNGETTLRCDSLNQMPHGLQSYQGMWAITNTTRGEWWLMDPSLQTVLRKYSIARLAGKVSGTTDVEWVQKVIPLNKGLTLFVDTNRGLIAVDVLNERYSVYQPNPNWCIQDALCLRET